MGSYGRRGPRVARFGRVALWAMEETPYQVRKTSRAFTCVQFKGVRVAGGQVAAGDEGIAVTK